MGLQRTAIALAILLAAVFQPAQAEAHAFRHPHRPGVEAGRFRVARRIQHFRFARRVHPVRARRAVRYVATPHAVYRRLRSDEALLRRYPHDWRLQRLVRVLRVRLARMQHRAAPPRYGNQSAADLHPRFHRIARGVGFWEGALLTPAGRVRFSVLKVDLHLADVAPVAALTRGGGFALERTSTMALREHAIAGINGSFFSPRSRAPAGMLIVEGKLLAGPVSRPVLVVHGNGTASILPDRSAMRKDPFQAVGGGPTLLRNGRVVLWGRPPDIGGRQPRTAVGLCPDRKVLLVTIDGRSRASAGATLAEEARYMLALGARNAINLDGGGSTTMVIKGHVVNAPADGSERCVSDALMVFAKGQLGRRPDVLKYSGYGEYGS